MPGFCTGSPEDEKLQRNLSFVLAVLPGFL
jgi:hypothetical protein